MAGTSQWVLTPGARAEKIFVFDEKYIEHSVKIQASLVRNLIRTFCGTTREDKVLLKLKLKIRRHGTIPQRRISFFIML